MECSGGYSRKGYQVTISNSCGDIKKLEVMQRQDRRKEQRVQKKPDSSLRGQGTQCQKVLEASPAVAWSATEEGANKRMKKKKKRGLKGVPKKIHFTTRRSRK